GRPDRRQRRGCPLRVSRPERWRGQAAQAGRQGRQDRWGQDGDPRRAGGRGRDPDRQAVRWRMTMSSRSVWLAALIVLAACVLAGPAADEPPAPAVGRAATDKDPPPDLPPKPPEPVSPGALEASILRGVAFLLADQNKDGSWGSPELTGVE